MSEHGKRRYQVVMRWRHRHPGKPPMTTTHHHTSDPATTATATVGGAR